MKPAIRSVAIWGVLISALLVSSCGGGSAKPTPGTGCVLNSECAQPLVCTFAICHSACVVNGDCPTGALCVKAGAGAGSDAATVNVCQLPAESKCVYNSDCRSPLVCARDEHCRNQCQTDVDCISPQVCSASKVCALPSQLDPLTNDVPLVTTGRDGGLDSSQSGAGGGTGSGGSAVGGRTGSGGGGAAGRTGTGGSGGQTCTGPQLQFSNMSQGDTNPNFNSAVAVRNADTLFIFDGYEGPAHPDGGVDGGILAGDAIFVQTFDARSGDKRGAAKFLFSAPSGVSFGLAEASIASTGEIALLYAVASQGNAYADQLYLTILAATAGDGGATTLAVEKTVQLESVSSGDAHVIWDPVAQLFVFSWKYLGSNNGWYTRVRKYHPNGTASGSAINAIPTLSGNDYQPNQEDDGYVGVSGAYLGMGFQSNTNNLPYLTIVDSSGLEVGPIINLLPATVDNWVAAAGTTQGFVTMFTIGGRIQGTFVPITGKSSVIADAGASDAGAPPLKMFSFTSTAGTGKIISDDDLAGAGGVGAVFLETNGASFVYVTADASKQLAQGAVITASGAVQADISSFAGSFVVSLFSNTTHAARATVSSCN